jgi:hypothetical protein
MKISLVNNENDDEGSSCGLIWDTKPQFARGGGGDQRILGTKTGKAAGY